MPMKDKTARIRKTTNKIFATFLALSAIPVKPKSPVIIAITKKAIAKTKSNYSAQTNDQGMREKN